MNNKIPKPPEISLITPFPPQYNLIDRRMYSNGIVFGTIEEVAKQYGIKMKHDGGVYSYTAPKSRLQLFAEKLHFSKTPFREV